jgi:glucose/mannose transport system permease protein
MPTSSGPSPRRRVPLRHRLSADRIASILVLAPSVILLCIFVYGFIAESIHSSLIEWQGVTKPDPAEFVGLDNYKQLMTGLIDARFRQALVNTFFFTILFIVGCLGMGLLLAILLDRQLALGGLFRNLFLYPLSLSFIVTGTVWRWLFNPTGGINRLPELFGLEPLEFAWLTDRTQVMQINWQHVPRVVALACLITAGLLAIRYQRRRRKRAATIAALVALLAGAFVASGADVALAPVSPEMHGFSVALIGVVIAAAWQESGYVMAMLLAGMTAIPEEVREAARVDGANEAQVYTRVVLPMLQPVILGAVIVLGHISLKVFDLVFALAGPDNGSTDVPSTLMFMTAFRGNQFAKGAAIAVVMLVMVVVVIVPYLVSTLRSEARS